MAKSGFANTSITSPFSQLASSEPVSKSPSTSGKGAADSTSQKPMSSFGSSISLSGLSTAPSPFGALGPASSGNARTFGLGPFAGGHTSSFATGGDTTSGQTAVNELPAPSASSACPISNVMAPSPFGAASGTSSLGGFGSGTFGSSFGQNTGFGASKLTSFANPGGGDLATRKHSTIKPIGTTQGSEDEGSGSEGDEEGDREHEIEEEKDPRFQQQQSKSFSKETSRSCLTSLVDTGEQGEESKFSSSRAKLYGFEDKAWKERGAGVFKFNVSPVDLSDDANPRQRARFIMRAHQTYRILLNTPVFKQMMVGDPVKKGQEPTSKSLLIAVVTEEGKAMPYQIRVHLEPCQSTPRTLLTYCPAE